MSAESDFFWSDQATEALDFQAANQMYLKCTFNLANIAKLVNPEIKNRWRSSQLVNEPLSNQV